MIRDAAPAKAGGTWWWSVKGTEFFDGASKQYVDFPITDVLVLQMMGRAYRAYGQCVVK